jgi:hypothetical protein
LIQINLGGNISFKQPSRRRICGFDRDVLSICIIAMGACLCISDPAPGAPAPKKAKICAADLLENIMIADATLEIERQLPGGDSIDLLARKWGFPGFIGRRILAEEPSRPFGHIDDIWTFGSGCDFDRIGDYIDSGKPSTP